MQASKVTALGVETDSCMAHQVDGSRASTSCINSDCQGASMGTRAKYIVCKDTLSMLARQGGLLLVGNTANGVL